MFRLSLKGAWGHKRRLFGTALAVFLGVAFLSGTLVLGDTVSANFDDLFAQTTAGTDAIVRNPKSIARGGNDNEQSGLIDAGLVEKVRRIDGVAAAEPSIEGYGAIIDHDGDAIGGNGPPRLAGNWIDDPDLNPYRLAEGRAPAADDEVVVNRWAADEAGLEVGDTVTVQVPTPLQVEVVGIARFGDEDGLGQTTFTAFTFPAAQRYLTQSPDLVSSVLVKADPGVSQTTLVERITAQMPSDVETLTGAELTQDQLDAINADFLTMMRNFLTMFAGIALLVATFSIYNTFSIIVAQRTREMALLRAVGAGRRQVLAAIVVEAIVVGVLASTTGVAAGLGVAALLEGMFHSFGFPLPTDGMVVTTGAVVTSLVVGMVATLVAATAPARRASRIAPLAALRDAAIDRSDRSRARVGVGAVVLGVGVAAVLVSVAVGGDAMVSVAGLGAVACLAGVVIVGPVVARPANGLLGLPLAWFRGMGGVLARRNAMRNPRRTSATASALLVGVGVVVVFTVFAASIKTYINRSVDRTFGGDLVASSPSFGGPGVDPAIAPAVGELPEVAASVGLGGGAATVAGKDRGLMYADPAALDQVLDLDVTAGSVADLGDDQIAVAKSTAEHHNWRLGDSLPVDFLDGGHGRFTIAALYDETSIVGPVFMPRAAFLPHAVQALDNAVFVKLADDVDLSAGKAAVSRVVYSLGGPEVQDREEYAAAQAKGLDMMLGVIYALLALAIVIALMGIANTLALSIHERRRELGVLRAVGQTRRQLRAMVRHESILIAVFGTVGGLGLGLFLGWALVEVVASSADIGVFTAPVGRLATILVVGAVAGVLAGIRPARKAARVDVLAALRST